MDFHQRAVPSPMELQGQMFAAPNDHNESDCVEPDQRFF